MKKYILAFILYVNYFQGEFLNAQDKQIKIDQKQFEIFGLYPCGEESFYLAYGNNTLVNSNVIIMKYNMNLEEKWPHPIQYQMNHEWPKSDINIYTYSVPESDVSTSYLYRGKTIVQISSNGKCIVKKTEIPYAELNDTAVVFADADGLNIITLTGKRKYKSGSMSWYQFSHDNLNMTVKKILLPLPPAIDKKNDSDWRLLNVSQNGLIFGYISYKNDTKDNSRPILAFHIVKVDANGSVGNIISMVMGIKEYQVVPAFYKIDSYEDFKIFNPDLFKLGRDYNTYHDNSLMGIKIDEETKRIYTTVALNKDFNDPNSPTYPVSLMYESSTIRSLLFSTFNLEGEFICEKYISYSVPGIDKGEFNVTSYYKIEINLQIPKDHSGLICKVRQKGNLNLYVLDEKQKLISETNTKITTSNKIGRFIAFDIFGSVYYSIQDFLNSPYLLKEESELNVIIGKLHYNDMIFTHYLNMKNFKIFAYQINKENAIWLNYYKK